MQVGTYIWARHQGRVGGKKFYETSSRSITKSSSHRLQWNLSSNHVNYGFQAQVHHAVHCSHEASPTWTPTWQHFVVVDCAIADCKSATPFQSSFSHSQFEMVIIIGGVISAAKGIRHLYNLAIVQGKNECVRVPTWATPMQTRFMGPMLRLVCHLVPVLFN